MGEQHGHGRFGLPAAQVDGVLGVLAEAILRQSDAGVVLLDHDLRFVMLNEAAAADTGHPIEAHIGRTVAEMAPALAAKMDGDLRTVLATGEPLLAREIGGAPPAHAATGQAFRWWSVSYLPVRLPDEPDAPMVAIVYTEVTGRVREAAKLASLADLSRALNGAETTEEIVGVLLGAHGVVDGAAYLNIGLLDAGARCLRVSVPPDFDRGVVDRWATMALDDEPTPFLDAFHSGETVVVRSIAERAERYPNLMPHAAKVGVVATVAIPLCPSNGEPFGVLGVGWAYDFDPDPAARARLDLLADLCSQAFQRARRADVVAELLGRLQRELLPEPDPIEGIDVAVGYRPGGLLGFGGDWYDVLALRPDVVGVVVGDVVGHGIEAAAVMAQAKGVVRAHLVNAPSLAHVLPQSTRSLGHLGEGHVATAAIAVLDRTGGHLSWVGAGHPPPVLRSAEGRTQLLVGPVQPPIGLTVDLVAVPTCAVGPGAILVLYTDGLLERRNVSLDERLAQLVAAVDGLPVGVPAAEARDRIVAAMVDGPAEDDAAIVVVTIT